LAKLSTWLHGPGLMGWLVAGVCAFLPPAAAEAATLFVRAVKPAAVALAALPPEAQRTLALIKQGGPFAYRRDGAVFGNREHHLPQRPPGYYHEYTVPTPGASNRGARRIIAGGDGEFFYTEDHYRSFRLIRTSN
jgi:ribonuclease T1